MSMDLRNWRIIFPECDGAVSTEVEEFEALPYANKACFTKKDILILSPVSILQSMKIQTFRML
jgi:uncharacterized protein (DUF1919 family)